MSEMAAITRINVHPSVTKLFKRRTAVSCNATLRFWLFVILIVTPLLSPVLASLDGKHRAPVDDDDDDGIVFDEASSEPDFQNSRKDNVLVFMSPSISMAALLRGEHIWELAAISFIVLYVIAYLRGKSANLAIATAWHTATRDIFEAQFASSGCYSGDAAVTTGATTSTPDVFLKDSHDCYKFWASGRRFCTGMLATIELRKRQDIVSSMMSVFDLSVTRDTVTLEFPMSEEHMDTFVFAIVKRREEKRLRKSNIDLENFTVNTASKCLSKDFVLMSDTPDLENVFCDERVVSTLNKFSDLFCFMHFTDNNSVFATTWKKVLRFKFCLPALDAMPQLCKLTEMALFLVDRVGQLKLSAAHQARNQDARAMVARKQFKSGHLSRQEAVARKKEEEREKEVERIAKLPIELQQKMEAKMHRENQKRNAPKVRVLR